jgi:hypothetical protein
VHTTKESGRVLHPTGGTASLLPATGTTMNAQSPTSGIGCAGPDIVSPAAGSRHQFRPRIGNSLTRRPWIRQLFAAGFRYIQRVGLNLTPNHFYWPIPDFRRLEERDWQALSKLMGVRLGFPAQLRRMREFVTRYRSELNFPAGDTSDYAEFHLNNGFFETVDAEIAHCMVRHWKPRLMIEIGGGNTTRLAAAAMQRNAEEGRPGKLISVEPHPDPGLRLGFPGLTELIDKPVQELPLEFFESLQEGDILFLDSSHVVTVGSDVVYEYLEILPRLRPGVIVHIHDVFLPADYPRKFVMQNLCFWGEQYMLQAFLSFNHSFEVLWSSSALQFTHREELELAFPKWHDSYLQTPRALKTFTPTFDGRNVWPCSFWMRRSLNGQ